MTPTDLKGSSAPLGATLSPSGTNFSLYSREATGVDLLFFDHEDDARPSRIIPFDSITNRSSYYWHIFVPGITAGQLYAYRVYGPFDPANGLRFDPEKALLDPYGKGLVTPKITPARPPARKGRTSPRP